MKGVLLPLAATAAFIVIVGIFFQRVELKNFKPGNTSVSQVAQERLEVKIGETSVSVTVADSEEERIKGLSGQEKLEENEGMLFVFDQKDVFPSFWMKNMSLAIDIIWINDGSVVKLDKAAEPPAAGTPDSQLKLYTPDKPIDYVLEVNAGFSDKNNIQLRDPVDLSAI